jgi:hypothetical protein
VKRLLVGVNDLNTIYGEPIGLTPTASQTPGVSGLKIGENIRNALERTIND